jgi:hypothetical protein
MKPRTGSFIEIDDRVQRRNLLNYVGRVREKYHEQVSHTSDNSSVKSIHEMSRSKGADLERSIIYDTYPRGFGIERFFDRVPTADEFYRGIHTGSPLQYDRYTLHGKRLAVDFHGPIEKRITLEGAHARTLQITYTGQPVNLGVEFSIGIFNKDLKLDQGKSLREVQELTDIERFAIVGNDLSPIGFSASDRFSVLSYPIETVSSSEAGYEKNFQGFCLLLLFRTLPTITIEL